MRDSASRARRPDSMASAASTPSAQLLSQKREIAAQMLDRAGEVAGNGWAGALRASARDRFLDSGAPVRRDEYWKYTDPVRCTGGGDAPSEAAGGSALEEVAGLRLRMANGGLEVSGSVPDGLEMHTLAEVASESGHWAEELLGQLEAAGQNPVARPLAALNTAMMEHCMILRATGPVSMPVHLAPVGTPRGGISYGRTLVKVEPGASLTLLEESLGEGVRNAVLEADVEDGGTLDHVRVQIDPGRIETTANFARLGEGSTFRGFFLTVDGQLTRNETVLELNGTGASGRVAGGVLGRSEAVIDNTVLVIHTAEGCESRQVYKSVLDDRARSVFQGKVLVRQQAQRTDGYQISQAVLLGERAEFDSKPELEIYADDVKCSHGSTAGALDDSALFYLRSRGVERREAESMLVAAFLDEVIEEVERQETADVLREAAAVWMRRRQRNLP